MNIIYYSLLTLFLILSLFMVLLVLIQKGRGGGLSSAFGGVGGNTAFGSKTGDVLTWATSIVFGVFLLLAIGLNLLADSIHKEQTNLRAPAAATEPAGLTPGVLGDLQDVPAATLPTTAPVISPTTLPATQPAN